MIIFPAIDLQAGKCVRLVQGKKENQTVYSNSPGQVALAFQEQGAEYLHVVDLDGAFEGGPRNLMAITEIAMSVKVPFQVGGGLRTREDVERLLALGASRVIIGTRAVRNPIFMEDLLNEFGADRIILGIDVKDGLVAVEGWVEKSTLNALEYGKAMHKLGVKTAVYTDISKDGLMQGPNLEAIDKMARLSKLEIIASGGVSSIENIRALRSMGKLGVSGAIIGKALYESQINLPEAIAAAR